VLGTALEEMREAKEALQDGMARRAPEREIDTLFDRYDQASKKAILLMLKAAAGKARMPMKSRN